MLGASLFYASSEETKNNAICVSRGVNIVPGLLNREREGDRFLDIGSGDGG